MSKTTTHPTVLVVGSLNMDLSVRTSRFPNPGETVHGGELKKVPGGKGANQATAAQALGCQVSIIGAVGDDDFGSTLLAAAQTHGIDTSHVSVLPGIATGSAMIAISDDGENTIIVSPGANGRLLPSHIVEAEALFRDSAVLCLSLETPLATVQAAARMGKIHGITSILNLSPYRDVPRDFLDTVDILLVNRHEAAGLLGSPVIDSNDWEMVQSQFFRAGLTRVVVTLGSQGAVVLDSTDGESMPHMVEPLTVQAVDTTGCGDAFFGAIAQQIALGAGLTEAASFAAKVASLTAAREGAQTSYNVLADTYAGLMES
ncbi:ribokinase [Paenarthrobacter sp. PH39-S1]|uniref:ribokinase n=1 Tax=Paenarthrobacter sp. PH39-S1 TaxID=3046204 RepID=UPI0024BB593F|nr:ribokinase [Paenarthrobacter sp. PH39-S1]MDJ0357602.1 ribokinase [Paenarthrobacter sp. PH39-S1]